MNDRERFRATMQYQPRDRSPIIDFGFWDETVVKWHDQGLPEYVDRSNIREFLGMDYDRREAIFSTGVRPGLAPAFEEIVFEDRGDMEVFQQEDGVRVLRKKAMNAIPRPLSHLLVDRDSWKKDYKPRLDPTNAARYPMDWEERVNIWKNPNRTEPIFLYGGSLWGWIRNWMGLRNVSFIVYDDPEWFEEMVVTIADCIVGALSRVLETGGQFEACAMWEDICYNKGPMINPVHFKKYLVPQYRRITDLLHKYGVDTVWVDSDGKLDKLIPLWLEGGVNCVIPFEVGTWGADPIQYRQRFGKDLRMMGGFSKRILAGSRDGINGEVYRLAPLVEEGGYICFCDHDVPPDVPLDNYLFYLETVREVWGGNVNLKPMKIRPNRKDRG